MAVRKTGVQKNRNSRRKVSGKGGRHNRVPIQVVFFLFLFIALIAAFFVFLPKVSSARLPKPETITEQETSPQPPSQPPPSVQQPPPQEKPPQEAPTLPEDKPAEQVPADPPPPPVQPAPETRDMGIYFMLDREGADLILTRVNRRLVVSQTPLLDCIDALLAGPTAEESRRGLASFMPEGSRILSARVGGKTAYLDFNEAFRYNILGREGSIAQLEQVVWTATEFPDIDNVQILIGGNRVDFLIEGIPIGAPLKR
jgi:hypothetical protein